MFNIKNKYSIAISTIIVLALLLTPIYTGYAIANTQIKSTINSTCSACTDKAILDFAKEKFNISANVLPDNIAQNYIKTVENSSKLVFGDKVAAISVKPQDTIMVYGLAENSDNMVIGAFINAITGKLISTTTLIWDGFDDNNKVVTTNYLPNGQKTVYNNTWKELKLEKAEKTQKLKDYMSNNGTLVASIDFAPELVAVDWEYWCCVFSGEIACASGCLVFAGVPPLYNLCTYMCTKIWSSNLC